MTNEEIAEEYTDSINTIIYDIEDNPINIARYLRKAVLYGLAEGKPKWHDLRKNPDDLPKETGQYLTDDGEICIYDTDLKKWRTLMCMACWNFDWLDDGDVLAWCESPKFKE